MLNRRTQHLLNGISDFFSTWFEDRDFVEAVFEGTNQLLGQAYFDLVVDFLDISLDDVEPFRNQYWKFLTFNSVDAEKMQNPVDGRTSYKVRLPDGVVSAKYIYNKMFNPTKILENGVHYVVDGRDLYFITDVFGIDSGTVLKGVPYRKDKDGNTVIALWGRDVHEDVRALARQFGTILGFDRASSEQFKVFLQGVYRYYQTGATLESLRSALNIMYGLPVVRDSGEAVEDVEYSVLNGLTVTTTSRDYVFPAGTKPAPEVFYIGDGLAISSVAVEGGELVVVTTGGEHRIPTPAYVKDAVGEPFTGAVRTVTLRGAQALTDTFKVVDRVSDPQWWHFKVFPVEITPSDPEPVRRTADPGEYRTIATSDPVAGVKAGDPGVVAGEGVYHRKKAYVLADAFWKHHAFYIERDSVAPVEFDVPAPDVRSVIRAGTSPRTIFIIDEASDYTDQTDTWDIDEEPPAYDLDPYASAPGIKDTAAMLKVMTRYTDVVEYTDTQLKAGEEFEAGYHVDGTPIVAGGTHPNMETAEGAVTFVDRMALLTLTPPVITDHYPAAAAPGDEVTIIGYDFFHEESPINYVRFGGTQVPATYWHTNKVKFLVPTDAEAGNTAVEVVARTQATDPVTVEVTV